MDFFIIDTVGDGTENGGSSFASIPQLPTATFTSTFDGTTTPGEESKRTVTAPAEESDNDDEDYAGLPPPGQSISNILNEDDDNLDIRHISYRKEAVNVTPSTSGTSKVAAKRRKDELCRTNVEQELKGAVLTPGIEKKEDIARLAMSDKALQKLNRLERKKTKGKNWFGLSAPEITPELENELALMKMRSILDPKQSFKRIDKRKTPKYFEIGKMIDSPLDHFNERGVKKLKSKSLVDELMADAEFQKYNKRKYAESLDRQKKKAYHKAVMKMKKEKKKSKKK
ncbi:deoxynucleotidyltransferase terminal-interacting protein 2 [Anopheles maculipalpis]|uniref:deoxynucleotidyltransferase terminal-interacting protein 2 n=1 Tax=Anopheles maculipalpis TaxID=1496333 RepID=UPI0021599E01|nr:deoxynucleotidyltransferase terminal-interacting protein 2 [Anopheles maculipalpis]